MRDISCPTTTFCVAVALGGAIISSADPSDESPSAWSIAHLEQPLELTGVSCESATLCVAVSEEGDILSSTDPTGSAGAWKRAGLTSFGSLFGLACPASSLCVTGNTEDVITSTQPTGEAGAWSESSTVTPSPLQLTAFSCATNTHCAAVDNNSDVLVSTDPTGGAGAWSFTNVIPAPLTDDGSPNGMFGISCPSTSLCLAAGASDQVIFSTAPFSPESATGRQRPATPPSSHHANGPRARITAHPPRRRATWRRWARVRFRFHALGKARGLQCRLGRRRFRSCRSPKSYRVGVGRHAFGVRAVGPSGVKGPAVIFRFKVKQRAARHYRRG